LVASDEAGDVTASVSFPVSDYEPTAWHFAEIDVASDDMGVIMSVKKQGEEESNLLLTPFSSLEAVYYAYDNVPPFTGCLRNMHISVDDSVGTPMSFPEGTPNIVLGVCPL
ncbi:unnamed protein product, partial [Dibothriocephalus latus]